MLITGFQKVIFSTCQSRKKIGLLQDKKHQASAKKEWKTIKAINEELLGYEDMPLHCYGERGVGKTSSVVEAFTLAGIPVILLYPATWVDNADAVGMPKVRIVDDVEVTKNIIRDFFPQYKRNEDGTIALRNDGGYMVDFEAIKQYIANYDDMLVYYEGDINQAPAVGVFWDEINRIKAEDVQQLMFSVMRDKKLGDYSFPNGTIFCAASNPNTGDYNVSALLEEEAFKDRFIHVQVENSLEIFNGYMAKNNFHWSVIELANENPETVAPKGEEYDIGVKASNRSMSALSSVMNFTTYQEDLEKGDFQEVVAGLVGNIYAARHSDILDKGPERVPTGEDIITRYDEVRPTILKAYEINRVDVLLRVRDNFLDIMSKEDTIDKYNMRAKKLENGQMEIPPNLDNVYKFFCDLLPETRVAITQLFTENPKVHPVMSRHRPLYDMLADDIARSNQQKKLEKKISLGK